MTVNDRRADRRALGDDLSASRLQRAMTCLLAFVLAALSTRIARAQVPSPPRSEVAIREVVLSDGTRRYAVPLTIGRTQIDAGLDTGSPGLRVLQASLASGDVETTDRNDTISFGAGAQLTGAIVRAVVRLGTMEGAVTMQRVDAVGCAPGRSDCAAGRVAIADYGIQGDGLPGEGFKAILGLNTAPAKVPAVPAALGVRRWIVELPRPGEQRPGRLILNPDDDEIAGFTPLTRSAVFASAAGGLHDAVEGCVSNQTSHKSYCGSVLLDTGAPGVTVEVPAPGARWPAETPAILSFLKDRDIVAATRFVTDRRDHASRFTLREGRRGTAANAGATVIYAGLLPYFAWSVLYDVERDVIALKARPATPDGPVVVR